MPIVDVDRVLEEDGELDERRIAIEGGIEIGEIALDLGP